MLSQTAQKKAPLRGADVALAIFDVYVCRPVLCRQGACSMAEPVVAWTPAFSQVKGLELAYCTWWMFQQKSDAAIISDDVADMRKRQDHRSLKARLVIRLYASAIDASKQSSMFC